MSEDIYSLNLFIKNSFDETMDYLKKNNIRIGGKLSLRTFESLEEFQQIYKTNEKFEFARYVSEKVKYKL
jgi:translation initiation factor 2B subunit (eIF-2B alpha/beta/delta family)